MKNFYERFIATVEKFPAHVAIQVQHRDALESLTYSDLRAQAECAAAFLAARGIQPGDRCAILADNEARWVAAYLGVLRLGAVAVPLDTAYKPRQIAALLRDSGARLFFTTLKYLNAVEEAVRSAGAAVEIVLLRGAASGKANFDAILKTPAVTLPPCPALREDTAVILYTSGTTSDPKGVMLTHGNLLAEIEAVFKVVDLDEHDSILGVLPLFHALAQLANLLLPFCVGASVVYLEDVNTTELLRALRERGISAFVCVPQFFYLIHQRVLQQVKAAGWLKRTAFRTMLGMNGALRGAGINLGRQLFGRVHAVLGPRMKILVTGGSRFDPQIGRDLYRLGFQIRQAYGLTETSGAATVMDHNDSHVASVGVPLPGTDIKILPPDSGATHGEIVIRGPLIMRGYFNRPEVNAAVMQDGWLRTGDLGYLDKGGRLYITGRKKEIIVLSSGKNIYPEEIEAHYLQSPYIKELCVMGRSRPDEPSAERLHAVVVLDMDLMRERKVLNAKEILRYEIETLSVGLPSHKRVLSYEVSQEELPRTTTRKLKRFEIERRVNQRAASGQETGDTTAAAAAPRTLTEEDLAWTAQPHVARAFEVITNAARNKNAVHPAANIELELGLDSMERVELLTTLEQQFGTQVPDKISQKIYTVRELVDAVRPADGGSGAGAGGAGAGDTWAKLLSPVPEDDPMLTEILKPKTVTAVVVFVLLRLCYAAAWLLLHFRVTGREHLPRQGPFLLCPNHQSYLDSVFLVCALPFRVLRHIFFVGASEYFSTPLTAWFARKVNLIPVDPDTNLLRAMQSGGYGLAHRKVLILFPEGERSIDGSVKKFKKGAPILSLHRNAPIVPVAFDGVFDVWPRGRSFQWGALLPGRGRVSLRFGAPLPPPPPVPSGASFSQAEAHYSDAAENLRSFVVKMWNALRARA